MGVHDMGDNFRAAYNPEAVDKAIKTSRKPIGRREAKLIHALLKGSSGYAKDRRQGAERDEFPSTEA
jgi:hypothetical protein